MSFVLRLDERAIVALLSISNANQLESFSDLSFSPTSCFHWSRRKFVSSVHVGKICIEARGRNERARGVFIPFVYDLGMPRPPGKCLEWFNLEWSLPRSLEAFVRLKDRLEMSGDCEGKLTRRESLIRIVGGSLSILFKQMVFSQNGTHH